MSAQLENAQQMLRVAEQKFTTATETFEEKLVEVQRKTREKVKEEFDGPRDDGPDEPRMTGLIGPE